MPEARLYDASRHEFMGRARLVCIGCVKRGVAAKGLQELICFLARELFCVNMPFYFERNRSTKLRELRLRFPSITVVQARATCCVTSSWSTRCSTTRARLREAAATPSSATRWACSSTAPRPRAITSTVPRSTLPTVKVTCTCCSQFDSNHSLRHRVVTSEVMNRRVDSRDASWTGQ
eukprot:scaffold64202_cov36-Phaeocystis_antarctica.AAC.2